MSARILLSSVALIFAGTASASACPDASYEKYLKALRALMPAVMAEHPKRAALVDFFQALPPDFACFNRLFGFGDGPAPLYSEPQLDSLFPQIAAEMPKQDYARKLVGLSVNARWEADQTGALRDASRSVLDSDTQLFVALLAKLSTDSERTVWAFLFGAPHPSNEPLSVDVQTKVCEASRRSCEISKQIYAKAVSEEHTNH